MWVACLALSVLLGQDTPDDPSGVVARLGAVKFADRESAEKSLEAMGRRALPALRSALNDKDPEVRSRASALVDRVEGALLTRASTVKLDFGDVPLPDVARAFTDQTGVRIILMPENARYWESRKVTLREPGEVPFWSAVDKLCKAGRLNYAVAAGYPPGRETSLSLTDARFMPSAPTCDAGPFRVTLVGLHYQRDVVFAPVMLPNGNRFPGGPQPKGLPPVTPARDGGENARVSTQFHAQLEVTAEPRLVVSQSGPIRVIEATDDKGQSLALNDGTPGEGATPRMAGYFGITNSPTVPVHLLLKRPEAPGKTLRKLKAVIPLTVTARKPNPLVVPLVDGPGKTYHNDHVTVTVVESKLPPKDRPYTVEISVRVEPEAADDNDPGNGNAPIVRRRDQTQPIEVVDERGRTVPCFVSTLNPESGRMTLTLNPQNTVIPKELRYYGLARSSAEVAFEFADVPIP